MWLLFGKAVECVYENYTAILRTLSSDDLSHDATSFGLLGKIRSKQFLDAICILMAVLPSLNNLSRVFQKGMLILP